MASDRKIILITGANTGLGLEVVKALYKTDTPYEIIVGGRSPSKVEAAIEAVKAETASSPTSLSAVQTDLESDESIEKAIEHVSSKYGRLDVLINNAGAGFDPRIRDGELSIREAFNKSWDTNVVGTQVLTSLAVPLLLKSSDPRLLFVTSGTSSLTETERFDNEIFARINRSPSAGWPKEKEINPITSYRSTKCGLNMLMREWHKVLKNDGVKVWCISPGYLATGLGGIGTETLMKMGAQHPSVGGEFIRDVVQGKRDQDVGKVIRKDMIQPW